MKTKIWREEYIDSMNKIRRGLYDFIEGLIENAEIILRKDGELIEEEKRDLEFRVNTQIREYLDTATRIYFAPVQHVEKIEPLKLKYDLLKLKIQKFK